MTAAAKCERLNLEGIACCWKCLLISPGASRFSIIRAHHTASSLVLNAHNGRWRVARPTKFGGIHNWLDEIAYVQDMG